MTQAAANHLQPQHRAHLDKLWTDARFKNVALCEDIDGSAGLECVGFASLPALAGDHACSPHELWHEVMPSKWVHDVLEESLRTEEVLSRTSFGSAKREDAWAHSHIRMQRVDAKYLTRAGANNAHFSLPRSHETLREHFWKTIDKSTAPNALGLYVFFHIAALRWALEYAACSADDPARYTFAQKAIITEAFALHFLEDLYAAGHVAGTWGSAPWRMGTHDYYSEFGLDVELWFGQAVTLHGDAHMQAVDLRQTGLVVRDSLAQLVEALQATSERPSPLGKLPLGWAEQATRVDVCEMTRQPKIPSGIDVFAIMSEIAAKTPKPGRDSGSAHLPRFRKEIGPFIGGYATMTTGVGGHGFYSQRAQSFQNVGVGVTGGVGLDGVVGQTGAGLIFLSAGVYAQTPQFGDCTDVACSRELGIEHLVPTVPSRVGLSLSARLPFWVLPGDLLILAPIFAAISEPLLMRALVESASGGLIPWQRKFDTSLGTFQFVVGREATFNLYGFGKAPNESLVFTGAERTEPSDYSIVRLSSLQVLLPMLEWIPSRAFSQQVTNTFGIQVGCGFDIATSVQTVAGPPAPTPDSSFLVFLKLFYAGRYYFN